MLDEVSSRRCFRFGLFRLDVARQQLYKNEESIELPRRLVRTLQLLVENHGKDLDKTYMMEQLWPATVVEDNNLTVIISMLRKVLGDDAEHKKYILTNPGRGYRFVADVTETGPEDLQAPARDVDSNEEQRASVERVPAQRDRFVRRLHFSRLPVSAAAGSLVLLLAVIGLWEWSGRQATPSLAVLPFQAIGTQDDDYLGLGMADGLITRLRNIRQVTVRPTAEVAKYQSMQRDPVAAGRDLHVASVLEGAVQRTGDQVSLRVKLLRIRDGATVWADEYHGKFADILNMQDQIAEQATRALAVKLDTAEQRSIRRHYTTSSEAYQIYAAARWYCTSSGPEIQLLERGIGYFQQAIAKDPRFALAYAGLASCYEQLANNSDPDIGMRELFPKAEQAAQRAVNLEPDLQEAYVPLAMAKAYYEWEFREADAAFQKSIELGDETAETHISYGEFLTSQGRFEEAEREVHKAQDLDPLSWMASLAMSEVHFFSRHFKEAAEEWEKGLDIKVADAEWYLPWANSSLGRPIGMIDALVKSEVTANRKEIFTAGLAYVYALQGEKPLAERYLQKLAQYSSKVDDYQLSLIYAALGDPDSAFASLDRAREHHSWGIIFLKVDPRLDGLRSDPRFAELLRKVHLSP